MHSKDAEPLAKLTTGRPSRPGKDCSVHFSVLCQASLCLHSKPWDKDEHVILLRPGQGLGGQSPLYAVHGGGGGPLRIKMALLPSVKTMNLGQWEPHHPGPPDSGPSPAWPPRGCFGPGPIAQASGWVSNMGSETWRLLGDDWSYTLCSWGNQGL